MTPRCRLFPALLHKIGWLRNSPNKNFGLRQSSPKTPNFAVLLGAARGIESQNHANANLAIF
jgi:hypothetical protein